MLSMSAAWNGLNGSNPGYKMLDYTARKGRAKVRIIAYKPKLQDVPQDSLKVVIQATENGEPIAEDPLYSDVASVLDLAREMHLMRNEGWEFTPNKAMTD